MFGIKINPTKYEREYRVIGRTAHAPIYFLAKTGPVYFWERVKGHPPFKVPYLDSDPALRRERWRKWGIEVAP